MSTAGEARSKGVGDMADEQGTTQTGTTAKTTDERTSFSAVFVDVDRGRVEADATDRLAELISAVEHCTAPGTMTITLKVEPQDPKTFEDTGLLLVTGDVKISPPRVKRAASIFYATGVDGQITREDPNRDDPRFD